MVVIMGDGGWMSMRRISAAVPRSGMSHPLKPL
jgi:hypothetical protein